MNSIEKISQSFIDLVGEGSTYFSQEMKDGLNPVNLDAILPSDILYAEFYGDEDESIGHLTLEIDEDYLSQDKSRTESLGDSGIIYTDSAELTSAQGVELSGFSSIRSIMIANLADSKPTKKEEDVVGDSGSVENSSFKFIDELEVEEVSISTIVEGDMTPTSTETGDDISKKDIVAHGHKYPAFRPSLLRNEMVFPSEESESDDNIFEEYNSTVGSSRGFAFLDNLTRVEVASYEKLYEYRKLSLIKRVLIKNLLKNIFEEGSDVE